MMKSKAKLSMTSERFIQLKGYIMFLQRKHSRMTTMVLDSVVLERGTTELSTI